jgi:hypothetical protein
LNGTFSVAQGIATSEDLILRAEGLSLVGRGNVDMADWTVDLESVNSKAVKVGVR